MPPARSTRSVPRDRSLSTRLDREWTQLNRRPAVLQRVQGWAVTGPGEPPLTSLDDLLRRAGHRTPGDARSDAMLGRVLAHAASDPLAARIVLQRILPGLLHIVRREQRREPGLDAFDVLIGEAWVSIVNYSVADRPTHIASRLLHDARHRAFTNPRRRRRVLEVPCSPDRLTEPREPAERSALEELAAVIVEARRRGVHERDVEIVRGILRHGTATAFASELRLHPRSVRYRRDAALARIRRAAVADHAA